MAEGFIVRKGGVTSETTAAPTITIIEESTQLIFTLKNNDDNTAIITYEIDDILESIELAADATSSNITIDTLDSGEYTLTAYATVVGEVATKSDEVVEIISLSEEFVLTGGNDTNVFKRNATNGDAIWTFAGHTDRVTGAAIDDERNIYTCSRDNTVRKIDSDGNQVWVFTGHTDRVQGISVDKNHVYSAAGNFSDFTVRKITKTGTQVWVFTGHTAIVQDTAVDPNGNVYSVSRDNTVRKLNSNGNQVWSFTGHTNMVVRVDVDTNGFVYSASIDNTVRKINPNGTQVWSVNFGAVPNSVAVDKDFNVYAAVATQDRVTKLDSNGNAIWNVTNQPAAAVLSVGIEGNVYTGAGNQLAKLNGANGNEVWRITIGTTNQFASVYFPQTAPFI